MADLGVSSLLLMWRLLLLLLEEPFENDDDDDNVDQDKTDRKTLFWNESGEKEKFSTRIRTTATTMRSCAGIFGDGGCGCRS
jgi:hypothetical protein